MCIFAIHKTVCLFVLVDVSSVYDYIHVYTYVCMCVCVYSVCMYICIHISIPERGYTVD